MGRPHTPESRAKLSAALKGRKFSPETLAKMAEARRARPPVLGRPVSAETRAKISATRKKGITVSEIVNRSRAAMLRGGIEKLHRFLAEHPEVERARRAKASEQLKKWNAANSARVAREKADRAIYRHALATLTNAMVMNWTLQRTGTEQ